MKACGKHVIAYKEAMIGQGIDRHLFCLYIVSKGKNIPAELLEKVIYEKWRLSTSQVCVGLLKCFWALLVYFLMIIPYVDFDRPLCACIV